MTTNALVRLDGTLSGLAMKVPCKAVSAANLTLSGEQTVNGVAVVSGDRVLVKDQDTASENGVYEVSTSAWSRTPDFDGNRDVVQGTVVPVLNAGDTSSYYELTTASPVIGTSDLAFSLSWGVGA